MDTQVLADRFEAAREHLRSVAFHLLGSVEDAADAVQAAWLKASGADTAGIQNLEGWLTTITVHECLDQLRARKRRTELPFSEMEERVAAGTSWVSPETDAILADGVSRALLIVLDRLSPAQRVAFVLHDVFAVPFDDIGRLLIRSPTAAKKLASRARARIRGLAPPHPRQTREHVRMVEAFLAASRGGDITTLLELLAPDVVRTVDRSLVPRHFATETRGARRVAEETRLFTKRARSGVVLLVDGTPGIAVAPGGRLRAVLRIHIGKDNLIHALDIIGDRHRLEQLTLTIPESSVTLVTRPGWWAEGEPVARRCATQAEPRVGMSSAALVLCATVIAGLLL
jgi:RNA polymerase sigma-70 factor (ECF subfamily)